MISQEVLTKKIITDPNYSLKDQKLFEDAIYFAKKVLSSKKG